MKKALILITSLSLFMLGERVISKVISVGVEASQFRFSRLFSGRVNTDVAIFGNSRALHSVYAPELEVEGCYSSFQLSYNGLSILSVENLVYDYLDKNSPPKVIILETSVFYSDQGADLQLSIYRNGSNRLGTYLDASNSSIIRWRGLFSLLDFNNEMLIRSLLFYNKTDQTWINRASGSFSNIEDSDLKKKYTYDSDRLDAFARLYKYLSEQSIELLLVAAPYHQSVSKLVENAYSWDKEISFAKLDGANFLDLRKLPLDDESFTDYLHTNIQGARIINGKIDEVLTELIGCRNE